MLDKLQEHWIRKLVVSCSQKAALKRYNLLTFFSRIWTRNIKKVEYIENFQSASCKSNFTHKAASIGAGEVGIDVNRALDKHGAVIVAGANPVSIPVGGEVDS